MIINMAHRGFSWKYPENTLLAFQKAIEIGADYIELDVFRSKDGEVVVRHDKLIKIGRSLKVAVTDLNYPEIRTIPLLNHQYMPKLEEVLN